MFDKLSAYSWLSVVLGGVAASQKGGKSFAIIQPTYDSGLVQGAGRKYGKKGGVLDNLEGNANRSVCDKKLDEWLKRFLQRNCGLWVKLVIPM